MRADVPFALALPSRVDSNLAAHVRQNVRMGEREVDGGDHGLGWWIADQTEAASWVSRAPEWRWGELGPGWEHAEVALAVVQADLTRTLGNDAPTLGFAWYEEEWGRVLFVGKGPDWVCAGNGGIHLVGDVASDATAVAEAVQDAVVDNLLGYRTFWPKCPDDGAMLDASVVHGQARWLCSKRAGRNFGALGELRLDR